MARIAETSVNPIRIPSRRVIGIPYALQVTGGTRPARYLFLGLRARNSGNEISENGWLEACNGLLRHVFLAS